MKPHFTHPNSKKPILQDRPPRPQVTPKLTLTKRIIGDWHLERKFSGIDPEKKRDEFGSGSLAKAA